MTILDICKKCKEAKHCCNDGADCADFELTIINQLEEELEVYKRAFTQMSVEYAIAKGLRDVRDIQYDILNRVREEIEKEKKL